MSRPAADHPGAGSIGLDRDLFPASFLRLLAVAPGLVRRLRTGAAAGPAVARSPGGPFLFRGHREYRPGDDLRRVDWGVLARHDRVVVREFEAEREARSEVWFDGSASTGPMGGRAALARACALACATGLADGGRVRLGVLRGGEALDLVAADDPSRIRDVLVALSEDRPAGRAELARALPRLRVRMPASARFILVSDLLSRADPGALHAFAGRGVAGALLHLRVPPLWSPQPGGLWEARDAETGEVRTVRLTEEVATRMADRAHAHAERWARHARDTGLAYLPFAPSTEPEALLRRLAREVP
ncbi:MAG TPA: DUF58 domain-containing protein [Planctomycetota bacterium]|nr:DUF58 domain-containing protein [Planctomycetota bacterium]